MRRLIGTATVRATLVLLAAIVGTQALGDDFQVSFSPYLGGAQSPGVAWNGSRFLIVWYDETVKGFADDVHGQFVSGDGELIDSTFPILADTSRHACCPEVASDGGDYLVVWCEMEAGNNMYGQMVSGTGFLIDTIIDVSVAPDTQWCPAVAYAGSTYLAVWGDLRNGHQPDIYGQLVSRSGDLIDTNFPIATVSYNEYPGVGGGDSTFLAVWRQGGDIYGQVVALNGTLVNSAIPICTAVNTQDKPHAAFDGTRYLVVWGDTRTVGWQVYGQFVTPEGTLVDTNFPILPCNGFRNAVSWNGANYLVVGGESPNVRILGQFVAGDGALAGSTFNVSTYDTDVYQKRPAVAFGTTKYLVVWEDVRNRVYGCDIWGNTVPSVGVEERPTVQGAEGKLQVWPNPFTHNAVVEFRVRSSEFVDRKPLDIEIYDLGGRLVEETGSAVIGEKLDVGVYFLKAKGYEPIKIIKLQ